MHQCPFSVAAKDQELLLTFTTLYLSQNLVVEVPRVGQVVVRHVATRRALILTPLHWGILKNFEGGRTVSAVLRQLIHARGCLPLGEFYELVVKAHGAAMLCETMDQAATAPPSRPWTWSANGTLIRRLTMAVVFIALLGLLFNRVGPPGHWWWWLTGWFLSCLGISAGFALAGGLLHAAGREIYAAGWVWRTALPRFEVELDDELAEPELSTNLALARIAPIFALAAISAWWVHDLTLPILCGLLWELAPRARGPFARLLRAVHYVPRPSATYGFEFGGNRRKWSRLRSWFETGEIRLALMWSGYAVIWALIASMALCLSFGLDARELVDELVAKDVPGSSALLLLALIALFGLGVAGCLSYSWLRKKIERIRRWLERRKAERNAPPPTVPTTHEIYEFLGRTHPFQLIPDTERMLTAAAFEAQISPPQEPAVMAGDRNPRLRVLYSGRVSVESAMLQLNQHELLPGTIFGEQALLHDASHPRTIRCSTACVILTLGRAVFEHRVKRFVPNHLIEDAANKIAFLRQIPITRGWPQAILASFARRAVVQTFARNALVLDQGRENTLFFLVLEGELKVVKDGRKVGRIRSGDIFGEISLLQNSLTHAAVVGHHAGSYLCISKPDFLAFLSQDTALALQIEAIASRRLGTSVFASSRKSARKGRR
jgi:CRP-like cAMP-binding protein